MKKEVNCTNRTFYHDEEHNHWFHAKRTCHVLAKLEGHTVVRTIETGIWDNETTKCSGCQQFINLSERKPRGKNGQRAKARTTR